MILAFSIFFFDYFSKDSRHMSKNIVSKNKGNYKLILFAHKEKNYSEIIKINITKLLTEIVCSFSRSTPTQSVLIAVLKNPQIITKTASEKNTLNKIDA